MFHNSPSVPPPPPVAQETGGWNVLSRQDLYSNIWQLSDLDEKEEMPVLSYDDLIVAFWKQNIR